MSKTTYLTESMIRALVAATAYKRIYSNAQYPACSWGDEMCTMTHHDGTVVRGRAFEVHSIPISVVPAQTFKALLRRGLISDDGILSKTGKDCLRAVVKYS